MAQWASSKDDEQQQGAGAPITSIEQTGPSSTDEVPHPLMDCGQGKSKNCVCNDPATGWFSVEVGSEDAASEQGDGQVGRASEGDKGATGNNMAKKDKQIAITGVKSPILGATHPINESGRLRQCKSIPPPHGATPPPGGQRTVKWKSVPQPPPHGATPPLGGPTKSG